MKYYPSDYAIEYSGAHLGVIIAFETSSSFVRDTGIVDTRVQLSGPVVSARPGPIYVKNVRIVG